MARGSGRGLFALLTALALTACTAGVAGTPSTTTRTSLPPATITTTTVPPTTSTLPAPSSTSPPTTSVENIDAEVRVPEGSGPFPAVVLVHGGGWITGGPPIMRPLAEHLNDNGFLTVNTRYALASVETPAYPQAFDDVACAVRAAGGHPDSDGTVVLIGHSAGAHIGAVVALTGDAYAADCPYPGTGLPDRFVGLAGPYDVDRLGGLMSLFFGEGPAANPEAWEAGNPQALTDANADLESLIMYGELDGLVDDRFAIEFAAALSSSGSASLLELVEGARHNEMYDPDVVGELIVAWLDR